MSFRWMHFNSFYACIKMKSISVSFIKLHAVHSSISVVIRLIMFARYFEAHIQTNRNVKILLCNHLKSDYLQKNAAGLGWRDIGQRFYFRNCFYPEKNITKRWTMGSNSTTNSSINQTNILKFCFVLNATIFELSKLGNWTTIRNTRRTYKQYNVVNECHVKQNELKWPVSSPSFQPMTNCVGFYKNIFFKLI